MELSGGGDDDWIELQNASGTIDGGIGNDNVSGTLAPTQSTQIATGDGNDTVNVVSSSTALAPVSISLGGGTNTLTADRISGKVFGNNGSADATNQFGSASLASSTITVSNSSNVGIFGSASPGSSVTASSSTNIGIFGSGSIRLENSTLSSVTSTLFGIASLSSTTVTTVGSSNVGIFGSALPNGPTLSTTITNSTNVGIFGSAQPNSNIFIKGGSNVGIFGVSDGQITLSDVTSGNNVIELSNFGTAVPSNNQVNLTLTGTTNVGIFGSASPSGPTMSGSIASSTNVGIFGAASPVGTVTVTGSGNVGIFGLTSGDIRLNNVDTATVEALSFGAASSNSVSVTLNSSTNVGIFGSASPTSSTINSTVISSTNVGIFGSANPTGDQITVSGGSTNIGIYGLVAGTVTLDEVDTATIENSLFGAASPTTSIVTVRNSQNVGIFGSASPSGSTLNATVTSSTNVGIFGSASPGTITVSGGSSNVGIFGSASTGTTITVLSSQNVGIFSGYDDHITLDNVQTARVVGGTFGQASGGSGITVTTTGGSSNVGIFGTINSDTVRVDRASDVGINLEGGTDQIDVISATNLLAITDDGNDYVRVRSGFDMLLYLGNGDDRAQIDGGELIRVIGESGLDQSIVYDGKIIQVDGGDDSDHFVVVGGTDVTIRGDAGSDSVDAFGGIGMTINGGAGNDQLRQYGSNGRAFDGGLVYALFDGQGDDDTLVVAPLLSVVDRLLPLNANSVDPVTRFGSWMVVPTWITTPQVTTYSSSFAMIGGIGNDTIVIDGALRLYGIGGDGIDAITLISGSLSELVGGQQDDAIVVNSSGTDNLVFGDQGDDTIHITNGERLSIFGEEGLDTIHISGGQNSFARGGLGDDIADISGGNHNTLAGESGIDQLTIMAGTYGIAAGGIDSDTLTISGGNNNLLLGQSGNDSLSDIGGSSSILSGGDGDDTLTASNRANELYGDDGDDNYKLLIASAAQLSSGQLVRVRELLYIDPNNYEPEARGSDTLDLSSFTTSANLNLSVTGLFLSNTIGLQSVIASQLQLILLGSLENIIGTESPDILIGSSESNRIDGRGGSDSISGLAGDDVLIGGTGNDLLDGGLGNDHFLFETSVGSPLGSDVIYEANNSGTDGLDFSKMPVGLGSIDLNLPTPQSLAGGLLLLTLRQSSTITSAGEIEDVIGTPFADTILGNGLDNRIEPGQGDDIIDGRSGSDIYTFYGRGLGNDMVTDIPTGLGRDTFDFAAFDSPLNIDLALTSPQNLGELTLTLTAGDSIENVVGTSYNDTILGNNRDNALFGAAGIDRIEGRAGNDRLVGGLPAIVLLDFDSAYRADRGDYLYSIAERNAIHQAIASKYASFDWVFTQDESVANSLSLDMARNYARVVFSQGRGGDVSGDAGEVDFRNIQRGIVSEVNVNSLLPTVRTLLTAQVGATYTSQDLSNMIVALTTTIAAHELAHTAGLRHGDAFGPIGTGYSVGVDLSQLYPAYTGNRNAIETGSHVIASPASVGTTIDDALSNPFFGERESIKLAFNEIGQTRREDNTIAGSHGSISTAEDLGGLSPLLVPNLAPATGYMRSGQTFNVSAGAVVGDLKTFVSGQTERDFYRFTGKAGDIVNVELLSNSLRPNRGDIFDGELRIYKADGTLIEWNDDDFEGTKDATLLDVVLPADGDYYIAVGLSTQPAIASSSGRYELFISRFAVGANPTVEGDTLIGGVGSDTLLGTIANDHFYAGSALATDNDLYNGLGGLDSLDLQGSNGTYTATSIEQIITGSNSPPSVTIGGPSFGLVGEVASFTFTVTDLDPIDANAPFNLVVNWGDGTQSIVTIPAGSNSIVLPHTFSTVSPSGQFAISATALDSRGLIGPADTASFTATGWSVMPDPLHAGQTILIVVGSHLSDKIQIKEACHDDIKISIRERESHVRIRGRVDGDVDRLMIFGLGGNDEIKLDDDIEIDAMIWGGDGNDKISGGEGNDIIWGGNGDDVIDGGEGRDIIIGGSGADRLYGDDQDDILIAGLTAYDIEFNQVAPTAFTSAQRLNLVEQRRAMEAILAEWTSSRSYATRRNNLMGTGTGSRSNGSYFLKANGSSMTQDTVFDDGAKDMLWGESGIDWFFANTDGDHASAVDKIMDGSSAESRTDIDRWW